MVTKNQQKWLDLSMGFMAKNDSSVRFSSIKLAHLNYGLFMIAHFTHVETHYVALDSVSGL